MTSNFAKAAKLRDLIDKIASKKVQELRPPPRVGKVERIDRSRNVCWVVFSGDNQPLEVRITPGNQPRYAMYDLEDGSSFGDLVRVDGVPGNYYITDVVSSPAQHVQYETDIQTATDTATSKSRIFREPKSPDGMYPLSNPTMTVDDVNDLWFQEDAGVWRQWDGDSWELTLISSTGQTTDGLPPSSSPTPTSKGMYGSVLLYWTPVLNADPVLYEVHVSTTEAFGGMTKVVETPQSSIAVRTLADGTSLEYNTPYFFRIVAKDADGAASPGETVIQQMDQIVPEALSAQSVTAESLQAILALVGTISTRSKDPSTGILTGPGTDISPTGWWSWDSAGKLRFEMPNDGTAIFRGDAIIDHLTVQTLTTLLITRLAEGAVFTLESSLSKPTQPPSIQVDHETFAFTDDGYWSTRKSVVTDGTNWYTTRQVNSSGFSVIEKWSSTGQSLGWTEILNSSSNYTAIFRPALAFFKGKLWLLCEYQNRVTLPYEKFLMLAQIDTTTLLNISSATAFDSAAYNNWIGSIRQFGFCGDPAVAGRDEFIIGQHRSSDGQFVFRRFYCSNFTTDVLTLVSTVTSSFSYNHEIAGLYYGPYDIAGGANRFVITNYGNLDYRSIDTAGNWNSAESWPSNMASKAGFTYHNGYFYAFNQNGVRYRYESGGNAWSGSSNVTWYVAKAYANATNTTQRGNATSFAMTKRARIRFQSEVPPGAATEIRYYLKNAAPSSLPTQSMTLNGSHTSGSELIVSNAVFTPFNDPATNTFGTGSPSQIAAEAGNFLVKGDSSGSWGDLTFDALGNTRMDVHEYDITYATNFTDYANGYSGVKLYYCPALRRCWMRGLVRRINAVTASAGSHQLLTFPTVALNGDSLVPASGTEMQTVMGISSQGLLAHRCDVGTAGTVNIVGTPAFTIGINQYMALGTLSWSTV